MKPCMSILLLLLVCAGCGDDSGRKRTSQLGFSSDVNHPFFPLTPGVLRIYEGEDEGFARRDEVRTLDGTHDVFGVACTAVLQEVFLDDVLSEVTTEWYAQDRIGNVWKFGEESFALEESGFVLTRDSWTAGVGDARPWIAFPADPQPGEWYSGYRPGGVDVFGVVSVTETVVVVAGTFENCMRLVENADDPRDKDIILYAPGVGRVFESNDAGRIELTSIRRR